MPHPAQSLTLPPQATQMTMAQAMLGANPMQGFRNTL